MSAGQRSTARRQGFAKRVTIVDLAVHLGMTKGTVSRALNGYADIAEGTRLRVRRAAEKMGYRPLSHAQAIRTGRVRSIGLILQMNEHDGHSAFVADFLAGLSEAASVEDWTLTVATASNDADTASLLQRLTEEKKADGFILPRTKLDDPRIRFLKRHDIPFVLYGRTGDPAGCAWFDIESETAMEEAVATLAGLGHCRIGFVPGLREYTYAKLRHAGFLAGMASAGLPVDPALVGASAVTRGAGAASVGALLDLDEPPTAIVCSVDEAAVGAYDAARKRGLRIGRDLSLISYDGVPQLSLLDPPLSTFSVDIRGAGERLAQLLIRRCRGEAAEDLRELARATFRDRGSHGLLPA